MHKHYLNSTWLFGILLVLVFSTGGCQPQAIPILPQVPVIAVSTPAYSPVPYEWISETSLFEYLEGLTSIQPYSGWRNSGSSGEAEALDYVAGKLGGFSNLNDRGLALERESFKVFSSVELWETQLYLTVNGKEIEVPADGLRGSRYNPQLALSLDSDGKSNELAAQPGERSWHTAPGTQ